MSSQPNSAVDQEKRLDTLRKRKRQREVAEAQGVDVEVIIQQDEEKERQREAALQAAAAAAAVKEEARIGEGEGDAVAIGAAKGLDNKGLKIPPEKKGYVEGKHHEGHVHLFGNVAEQLGRYETIYTFSHWLWKTNERRP